jgi:hypothetical protein
MDFFYKYNQFVGQMTTTLPDFDEGKSVIFFVIRNKNRLRNLKINPVDERQRRCRLYYKKILHS